MNHHILHFFCYCIIAIVCLSYEKKVDDYSAYYHLIRKSKKLSRENEPSKALHQFRLATEKVDYVHTGNYIYAAFEAKKVDSCDLAIRYLSKAIMQGYKHDVPHLSGEEFIQNFFHCAPKTNKDLKASLLQQLQNPNYAINVELKKTLDSLFRADQNVRSMNYSPDHIRKVDSSNFFFLKQLIDKHGFPDERIVGTHTAENIFYVILHYDDDRNNLLLKDILKEALTQGQISPQKYAWIIDRRLAWGPDEKEPFYYQMPTMKMKDLTREEIKKIDQRRANIGLKPLSEVDIEFTPDGGMVVHEDWTDY